MTELVALIFAHPLLTIFILIFAESIISKIFKHREQMKKLESKKEIAKALTSESDINNRRKLANELLAAYDELEKDIK